MKKPNSVGYFSSYDRGLECLLDMWPKVKEQVPEATLDVYYGWDTYDQVHSGNPERMKWKWQMIRKLNQDGVKEHGRVSHEELFERMKELKVWCYPTEFNEIFAITATKALAAGMIPVTTGCYALEETQGGFGYIIDCKDIYTNEAKQKQFINATVEALGRDDYDPTEQIEFSQKFLWRLVAKKWDEALDEKNTANKR